jgi:hypothetical protein
LPWFLDKERKTFCGYVFANIANMAECPNTRRRYRNKFQNVVITGPFFSLPQWGRGHSFNTVVYIV